MDREAALRKVSLLRQVSSDRGATPAECENAARLARRLMEDFTLQEDEVIRRAPKLKTKIRHSWVYWQQIVDDYGLTLNRFGSRGNLRLADAQVVIEADRSLWTVLKPSPTGYREVARNTGLDSFGEYLRQHAPRRYSRR